MRYVSMALAMVVLAVGCSSSESESPATTSPPEAVATTTTTTTAAPTSTTTAPTTTSTTQPTPTTEPPTTTTPTIGSGTWIIPDEVGPDVYRCTNYAARLDSDLEIIDSFLIRGNGVGLVIVQPTDAYLEVNGEIGLVYVFGPVDPIELRFTEGAYLVGFDIEPGRYRVTPEGGNLAYWARMNSRQEIINSNLSEDPIIVIVRDTDWALEYRGTLEPVL